MINFCGQAQRAIHSKKLLRPRSQSYAPGQTSLAKHKSYTPSETSTTKVTEPCAVINFSGQAHKAMHQNKRLRPSGGGGGGGGGFSRLREFLENVRQFIPCLRSSFFFCLRGDEVAHTNSAP